MSQFDRSLQRSMESQLSAEGYDLLDLTRIPVSGDRITRVRTLEEVMSEFDQDMDEGASTYIVRIRPKKLEEDLNSEHLGADGNRGENSRENQRESNREAPEVKLYQPDGTLNISYLEHNAQVLIESRDYSLARNIYQTILQSGQRIAQCLYGIGLCFEYEGKLDLALAKFEESITYHPSMESLFHASKILIRQGKDRYAAETLERALNLKTLSESVRFELHKCAGNCWTRLDHFEEAEKHYRLALKLQSSSDEIRSNLGSLYLRQNRLDDARRSFQDAVASNPANTRAWLGLAATQESSGYKQEAYESYVKALELNSSDARAVSSLVRLAYELKNYSAAERLVSQYCEGNPLSVHLLYALAGLQFHIGKIREAAETSEKILSLKPGFEGAVDLLRRIGRYS